MRQVGWGYEAAVGVSSPMNWTWLERSVPKSGYWRVLVVAMRASLMSSAQAKAALRPGVVKVGSE